MACPFFMPTERLDGSWLHAGRLPLGCGWRGHCTAPGHEGAAPADEELQEFCNLGYAAKCARLPQDRKWDSVRFGARLDNNAENTQEARVQLRYICERNHLPADHGQLEFHVIENHWIQRHPDSRVQRMAECFLAVYLEKCIKIEPENVAS
jgi:hypothetical protein